MCYDKFQVDAGDMPIGCLPVGTKFKLNPSSKHEFVVINSCLGEVADVLTGRVRRFPPYWWCFIFY